MLCTKTLVLEDLNNLWIRGMSITIRGGHALCQTLRTLTLLCINYQHLSYCKKQTPATAQIFAVAGVWADHLIGVFTIP